MVTENEKKSRNWWFEEIFRALPLEPGKSLQGKLNDTVGNI